MPSARLRTIYLAAFVIVVPHAQAGEPSPEVRTAPKRHGGGGIWKSAVPPASMRGEFDAHDPVGLAAGAKIKADCSINWTDPDTGKLYCFASATSQSYFQDWPKRNMERARKGWQDFSEPGS